MIVDDPATIDHDRYGTWVEDPTGDLGIIFDTERWNENRGEDAWIFYPTKGTTERWDTRTLTYRTDLPRAWTPDGQPPTTESTT